MRRNRRYRHVRRPFAYSRVLVAHHRSEASDLALATILSVIAGAANAGGFYALGQYTSHMTGYLSQTADGIAAGEFLVAGLAALVIGAFMAGAAFSTVLINEARLFQMRRQFSLPLAIQGCLMICFSWGGIFATTPGRVFAMLCLCFIMGMQNATITKISGARIRTTHATGMITDIGMAIGRAVLRRVHPALPVPDDRAQARILLRLTLSFCGGGVMGALGYRYMGFFFSLPLAFSLLALSVPSLVPRRRRV